MTDDTVQVGQLGTIVSWKVPSEVPYSTLRAGLSEAGIPPDLALELAPRHILSRALNEMRKGRVIRKLRREDKLIFFQFTKEYLDAKEITYEREAELSLNVDTGEIECTVPDIREEAIKLFHEHEGKRLTSDLTRLLQRIYNGHSADLIPIREQGGAYFVPDMHRNLVDQSRTLLNAIGGNLRSFDVRLGSDETAASVAESMSEYLTQLIEEFKATCEDVDGTSRKDVKQRRRGTVAELRQKLELYRGLLAGYADHIDESIKTAEEDLLRKLATGGTDEQKAA